MTFNEYELGGIVEIDITPTDQDDVFFEPTESRLTIQNPTGALFTVSGGDLTAASGYYFYLYRPPYKGFYAYETWIKDGTGREIVTAHGFEILDTVMN